MGAATNSSLAVGVRVLGDAEVDPFDHRELQLGVREVGVAHNPRERSDLMGEKGEERKKRRPVCIQTDIYCEKKISLFILAESPRSRTWALRHSA